MELKVIFVFLCGVCALSVYGQIPPNPLFASQDAINLYHEYYEDMKTEIRGHMSGYVSEIMRDILAVLTATIDTWRRHQVGNPAGKVFRQLVMAKNTPEMGETVRACSDAAYNRIHELQDQVFLGLEEWHDYITELQISVARKIGDFDLVRRSDYFSDEFNPVIEEAHYRLQYEFYPAMEPRLRNLRDSHEGIVEEFRQCISSVLRRE